MRASEKVERKGAVMVSIIREKKGNKGTIRSPYHSPYHPHNPYKYRRLIEHMVDSGRSMQRNIEEGFKRTSTKEYISFLGFSRASLEEIKGDTDDCYHRYNLINEAEWDNLKTRLCQNDCLLGRQIASLERKMDRDGSRPMWQRKKEILKRRAEIDHWLEAIRPKKMRENEGESGRCPHLPLLSPTPYNKEDTMKSKLLTIIAITTLITLIAPHHPSSTLITRIDDFLCPPAYAADKGGGATAISPCHCEARRPMSLRGAAGDEAISDKAEIASSSRPSVGTPRNDIRALWRAFSDFLCPPAYAADKGNPPVAYWRFDEGGGPTAYDDSANNNDGTLNAGATGANDTAGEMWTTQGKISSALEFDGDDYVNCGSNSSVDLSTFSAYTITAWVKLDTKNDDKVILSKGDSKVGLIWYDVGDDDWRAHASGVYARWTEESPTIGKWYHIANVWTGTELSIWVNGVKGSITGSLSSINDATADPLLIGMRGSVAAPSLYFDGLIDDARVYDYARTAAQIAVDYNAGMAAYSGTGTDPNEGNSPVGYWKLDENTGTAAYDRSGNGHDGTITGADWAAGKYGTALNFVEEADYVSVPGTFLDALSAITEEVWIKPNELCQGTRTDWDIFLSRQDPWGYIAFNRSGSDFYAKFRLTIGGVGKVLDSNFKVNTGQWYHIVGTYDGSKMRIYINGEEKNDMDASGSLATTANVLTIGDYADNYHEVSSNAIIDEVKIYDYARTQAQIAYDYSKGAPVAHYRFDEGAGTIAHNSESSANSGAAPVGWWRMDNNWNDASGNGNNGTAGTSATFSSSAKIGPYCGSFDGTLNAYVSIPTTNFSSGSAPRTIEAWVYQNSTAARYYMAGYGTNVNNQEFLISVNEFSAGQFSLETSGNGWTSSATLSASTWYHLAVTYSGSGVPKFYVNGVEYGVASTWGSPSVNTSTAEGSIGRRGTYSGYNFNGLIDDARIYNYARTAEQIYNDYKSTHGTLVGDTKFVDGKLGKALSFDGTGDYVDCGSDASTRIQNLTIEMWAKEPSNTGYDGLVGTAGANGYDGYRTAKMDTHYFQGLIGDASSYELISGTTVIDDNIWHHLAFTVDASYLRIYVDGVEDQTAVARTKTITWDDNLIIGNYGDLNTNEYWNGLIDDVRVYNYGRSAAQVMTDYNAGMVAHTGVATGVKDPWAGALPVAHWKLDENTGVLARDASENNNDGTLGGDGAGTDVPTWIQGKKGPCLSFDGSNDKIDISDSSSLSITTNEITCEAWVYVRSHTSQNNGIISKYTDGSNNNWNFMVSDSGGFHINLSTVGADNSPDGLYELNVWNHLAWWYDGDVGEFRYYVNGVLVDTDSGNTGNIADTGSSDITIGSQAGNIEYFNGLIDDIKIYNYARTQAQIAWDYNRGAPVAHFRFDESSGTDAYDDSGNNNATITIGATAPQTTIAAARTAGATGKFGRCLSLDGTDDYVDAGDIGIPHASGAMTLSFWMKSSSVTTQGIAVNYGNATDGQRVLNCHLSDSTSGKMSAGVVSGTGGWQHYESNALSNDTWHHFTLINDIDNSKYYFYQNGVLLNSGGTTYTGIFSDPNKLRLGNYVLGGGYWYGGLIDDVRIYNYARTAAQVMQDYNQGLATKFGD